ncbi:unnamed protein product [Ilex paraguariensis]|uniref:Uncharacterized protein n=1 Tax=Ilex paraguariensis TaxID=185542 RepID=A0ABC8S358_9AQUA
MAYYTPRYVLKPLMSYPDTIAEDLLFIKLIFVHKTFLSLSLSLSIVLAGAAVSGMLTWACNVITGGVIGLWSLSFTCLLRSLLNLQLISDKFFHLSNYPDDQTCFISDKFFHWSNYPDDQTCHFVVISIHVGIRVFMEDKSFMV